MAKNIIDIYGRSLEIDETSQSVVSYNNAEKKIRYNAPIVENGKNTDFYTDYEETGIVTDLETRIRVWNSRLHLCYASQVDFNASGNDPHKTKWKHFVECVREQESKFFDENGDYRETFLVTEDEIKAMIQNLKSY